MLSVGVPLAQVGSLRRLLVGYAAGAILSASALGLVLALVSPWLRRGIGEEEAVIAVVVSAALLGLGDLGLRPLRTPSIRRQTAPIWLRKYGERRAFLFWGLDLGLGFTTIRVASLYWLLLVMAALVVPITLAPLVTGLYGVALAASMATVVTRADPIGSPRMPALRMIASARRVQRGSGVALLVIALMTAALQATGG